MFGFLFGRSLKGEFDKRKPWVTKFVINGQAYGGDFDAMSDQRLAWFFQDFPEVQTVMELGSLEGGHTFALAQHAGMKRVLGIEGRQYNVDKARFVQEHLGVKNVEFVTANLETTDLASFGQFDAVFCVGLLYHLPNPWDLLHQISYVTSRVFIWTHYADPAKVDQTVNGYPGWYYREHGMADPLSGMSAKSFWPILNGLKQMLGAYGFTKVHLIQDDLAHPHGPSITLSATKP